MQHATLVLGDPLVMRPRTLRDRLLARAFGASLDRELAAARPPEASRRLAARAQDIVALRRRRAVAADWDRLLTVATRARSRREPARHIRDDLIVAAGPAIRELVRMLSAPSPVAARGVAMASVLLTDGTGPVYRRGAGVSLDDAIRAAITQLDPALPLMPAR